MSIPSLNKPSDYDKYFSRYLADLSLQVKLNQENYDANVAFFKTGVQATERADTRSLEQRSTDVETLKIQARAMLNKLTNSNAADEVLTFLLNSNLLFFFVQNFVDFERTINKRYPSQTASAPILRVLIQKSFDKQNEEIPLLKDELIVATNSVASREIIQKVLTDVYNKQDTNVVLYETLQNNLYMFPTMQEKMNIVKFPERKFKDENDIAVWNSLPSNKTIEQLLDLYEQLYSEDAENIESIQNQINNIEDGIENQLFSVTDIKIKSKLDESKANKQLLIQKIDADRARKELLENTKQRITLQKSKATQEQLRTKFKQKEDRENQQYQQAKEGQEKVIKNLKHKERQKQIIEDFKTYRPRVMEYEERQGMNLAEQEQRRILKEQEQDLRLAKANKGRQQQTIDPASYMSASKSVSKPKGNLKPNVAIQEPINAEPVEELEIIPKKVKSNKATATKEEPKYVNLDQSLYQQFLDDIPKEWKLKELKEFAKKNYGIKYTKLKEETGDNANETNLKKFIATQQYYQANKYTTIPIEIEPLNELTRGSYSDKVFIPDPNASISRQPPMEGKGLLTKRQQDSHRFKVLQGQILAGNNSKKIVMELKALILKMTKLGEISNKKASAVLQELNSVLK
jgi:hypothetical protein